MKVRATAPATGPGTNAPAAATVERGLPPQMRRHKQSYQHRWESAFGKDHRAQWHPRSLIELVRKEGNMLLLLVTLGVCAAVLDYSMNEGAAGLHAVRNRLMALNTFRDSPWIQIAVLAAFTAVVGFLGMLWTRAVDPVAAGSGIPEMKTIISFDQRKEADHFLGFSTLVSKAVGLMFALGSGLSCGEEGPFVHTASIIAHNLMKHVAVFHRIFRNDVLRRHVYNAACAVGIASTFRAPIGGVLFAIEVTSTVFMVVNYWRAFIAAISASIARQFVNMINETHVTTFHPMFPTTYAANSFSYPELAAFGLLGVVMGIGGAAYVTFASVFKRQWRQRTKTRPFLWSCVLLVITCGVLFLSSAFSRLSFGETIIALCSPHELVGVWAEQTSSMPMFVLLPVAVVIRVVATTFTTTLPLPTGDFVPTFVTGALLGRFYGEVARVCFPGNNILPGGYALVGGAAFVGSATHTVSVAIIAIEFTGQFVYVTPLILAVLLARGIGSALSVSMYESMIISKGLTYLPLLRVNELDGIKASDVMAVEFPIIPMETTLSHIDTVLERYASTTSFPVVDSIETMVFYGCVTRSTMERLLDSTGDTVTAEASAETDKEHKTWTTALAWAAPRSAEMQNKNQLMRVLPQREINLMHFQSVAIDSSVLQVDADTPVQAVHLLFETMKPTDIWVTRRGRLLGWIRRKQFHARIIALGREGASIAV